MNVKLINPNVAVFTCADPGTLDLVKGICGGWKLRGEPRIELPARSLSKFAKIFPKTWQDIMADVPTKQMAVAIMYDNKHRREVIARIKSEYSSTEPMTFDYDVRGKYAPLRHQIAMAKCVFELSKCGLLADPGTCKTGSYLWGIDYKIQHGQIKRALVITLSHLKDNVLAEMKDQVPHLSGVVLDGKAQSTKVFNKSFKKADKNRDYDIYIANYESMFSLIELFPDDFFQMVVLDEAHRVGGAETRQTKAIMNKLEYVPNKYIVTGTLVANNELSFYMPFRFMGPDTVTEADFMCFRQRRFYAVDPDQRVWVAAGVTKDLIRDLITKSAVCFRKEQCLDLPGVIYSTFTYDFDKEQTEAYEMAQAELVYIIKEGCDKCVNQDKCLECDNALLIKNALVCINKLAQITCGFFIETKKAFDASGKETDVSVIHQMPTNPKVKALMNALLNLPEDRKVIIWSTFTEGIRAVCKQIEIDYGRGSYIPVFGSVDAFAAVAKFKADPKLRFMVANQAKAGTGLNIQFSNYQVYFMNDYSYVKRDQAIARQDRKGQTEKVQVIDLVGKVGGKLAIDGIILKTLEKKKDLAYCLTEFANMAGAGGRG